MSRLYYFLILLTLMVAVLLAGDYRLLKRVDAIEASVDAKLDQLVRLANLQEKYRALRVVPPGKRDIIYPASKTFHHDTDNLDAFQQRCRNDIRRWAGIDEQLLERDVELKVLERKELDSLGIIREKVEMAFSGQSDWLLRGYLLYPMGEEGRKLPGIICLNGHQGKARAVAGMEPDYTNSYGLALARQGCKVLCFDWCFEFESSLTDSRGKRYSAHDSLFAYLQQSERGTTGLALYMENAYCALKALRSDSMVDTSRLGVTGISRGGELTAYFAALFAPEIDAFYASGAGYPFIYRRLGGGCKCTYVEPVMENYEFSDLLLAAAPLPFGIQLGVRDNIWGYWDNIEQIMLKVKPVYEDLGGENLFRLDIHPQHHVYNVDQSVEFFRENLIGD
jgi:dienelactone hydrolase